MSKLEKLLKEYSKEGKENYLLPKCDVPEKPLTQLIPEKFQRKDFSFIEVSEVEIVRHFIRLSTLNYHVDKGIYPLGSCTMKYNPKINEQLASLPNFLYLHPLQPEETIQGVLELMSDLGIYLCEIAGLDAISLQPSAGAQGELAAMLILKKYFKEKGEKRRIVLIPDSAHGTNPASVTMSGFSCVTIKSNSQGTVDLDDFRKHLSSDVVAMMITSPNTLGIFEKDISLIASELHSVGAFLYLDGANLNAYLGYHRPGDAGVDLVHFNLHKTFSTPHGGGGPGSGPIGVKKDLVPYLPTPAILKKEDNYYLLYDDKKSIGKIHSFYGNFNLFIKAYAYIRHLSFKGLKDVAENSVLNANYLKNALKEDYDLPYKTETLHEFVLSSKNLKKYNIRTLDIAKRLLDFGVHAPTVYFPLIVPEALMIEPTETESKESLEEFISALKQIAKEAESNPGVLQNAPHNTPVRRLDEGKAGRELIVKW